MRPSITPSDPIREGADSASLLRRFPTVLGWLKQQWLVAARLMSVLAGGRAGDEAGRRSMLGVVRALVDEQLRHMAGLDLKTNSLVRLRCRAMPKGRYSWTLEVNGQPPVALNRKEAFILRVLAEAAVRAGVDEKAGDGFVALDAIGWRVLNIMKTEGLPVLLLDYKEVRQIADRLRAKLPVLDTLIETKRGRGYRLSTAWFNVDVDWPGPCDATATFRNPNRQGTP